MQPCCVVNAKHFIPNQEKLYTQTPQQSAERLYVKKENYSTECKECLEGFSMMNYMTDSSNLSYLNRKHDIVKEEFF